MKPIAWCIALFLFSLPLHASIEFSVWSGGTVRAEPGSPAEVRVFITNTGPEVALDARVTIELPSGTNVTSISNVADGWTCTAAAPGIVCTNPALQVTSRGAMLGDVFIDVPGQHAGHYYELPITFTSQNVAQSHPFFLTMMVLHVAHVTTADDAGPASLRDAIETMNAICTEGLPCVVRVDLPAGSRIEPLTPLPVVGVCSPLEILAGPPTREGERPIELSGARVASGSGLEIRTPAQCASYARATLVLTGMAINGFPDDGIHVSNANLTCHGCYIGTDTTGTIARPNRSRGVGIDRRGNASLSASVVSGNARSGIFAWDATNVTVRDSYVGIAANGARLGNGASGIFMNVGGLELYNSQVAHNAQFGLSFAPGGWGTFSGSSIFGNAATEVDYGLDGPTASGPIMPDTPVLIDATYNPATNTTTVRGRVTITHLTGELYGVQLFLNVGAAEAQVPVAAQGWVPATLGTHDFTVLFTGDHRDQLVTAVLSAGPWLDGGFTISSELSNGVAINTSSAARTPW